MRGPRVEAARPTARHPSTTTPGKERRRPVQFRSRTPASPQLVSSHLALNSEEEARLVTGPPLASTVTLSECSNAERLSDLEFPLSGASWSEPRCMFHQSLALALATSL